MMRKVGSDNFVSGRRGFTLTELLVVISVIVLVMAMAIPLFNVFSGSRSIEGGQNLVSAMLQRARARAIGLQERRGVLFFDDAQTRKTAMVLVKFNTAGNVDRYVDLDLDSDEMQFLPQGIAAAFFMKNVQGSSGESYRNLGLVLFDGLGRLELTDGYILDGGNGACKNIFDRFKTLPNVNLNSSGPTQPGLYLYDRAAFSAVSGTVDPATIQLDKPQSDWLDANSTALIVNRYNGTIFKGE